MTFLFYERKKKYLIYFSFPIKLLLLSIIILIIYYDVYNILCKIEYINFDNSWI